MSYEKLGTELPAFLADLGIRNFSLQARAKSKYREQALLTADDVKARHRDIIYKAFAETRRLTGLYQ